MRKVLKTIAKIQLCDLNTSEAMGELVAKEGYIAKNSINFLEAL